MRPFRRSTWARASVIVLSFVILPFTSLGQDQTVSPPATSTPSPTATASATPSPTATATPDHSLKSARLVRATLADVYSPPPSEEVGPRRYPRGINPLTGLPYPSEEAQLRRNLIVKISNWPPRVRPQHGVNQADLVYEYEAEGGVTRFAALYRNNAPEQVGSLRSARLLDIELLTMYASLLAYSGTSGPIHEIYKNAHYRPVLLSPSLGDNCENAGFCRDETFRARGYEHTLFGDTQQIWNAASRRGVNIGFRALGFAFDLRPDADGSDVNDIYINWYDRTNARWQYDEGSGRFLRYTDGLPHVDAADDSQLWADNLVMLQVIHNRRPDLFTPGAIDESLEVALWGQGRAYVMREGKLYAGYWRRLSPNRGEALSLIYGDETAIMLKPGRTWVTILRSLDDVVLSDVMANMAATATAVANAES
ncbi:MAG: DUF3048 domain-containing protein [Chloroflexi bacterium]|nr:DUF3048 domain-containing protein [Chloroflexota bacterium]